MYPFILMVIDDSIDFSGSKGRQEPIHVDKGEMNTLGGEVLGCQTGREGFGVDENLLRDIGVFEGQDVLGSQVHEGFGSEEEGYSAGRIESGREVREGNGRYQAVEVC
jgi:hypothetical protein